MTANNNNQLDINCSLQQTCQIHVHLFSNFRDESMKVLWKCLCCTMGSIKSLR